MPEKLLIKIRVANVEQTIEVGADELPAKINIEISEVTSIDIEKAEENDKPISFDVGFSDMDDDEDWDDECDDEDEDCDDFY